MTLFVSEATGLLSNCDSNSLVRRLKPFFSVSSLDNFCSCSLSCSLALSNSAAVSDAFADSKVMFVGVVRPLPSSSDSFSFLRVLLLLSNLLTVALSSLTSDSNVFTLVLSPELDVPDVPYPIVDLSKVLDTSDPFFTDVVVLDNELFNELVVELLLVAAVLLADDGALSEIFPNFGLASSALASFCCFQLGVFQLGAFSSTFSTLGDAAAACFFHEGTGFSGVEGVELSGVVFVVEAFHEGVV